MNIKEQAYFITPSQMDRKSEGTQRGEEKRKKMKKRRRKVRKEEEMKRKGKKKEEKVRGRKGLKGSPNSYLY